MVWFMVLSRPCGIVFNVMGCANFHLFTWLLLPYKFFDPPPPPQDSDDESSDEEVPVCPFPSIVIVYYA